MVLLCISLGFLVCDEDCFVGIWEEKFWEVLNIGIMGFEEGIYFCSYDCVCGVVLSFLILNLFWGIIIEGVFEFLNVDCDVLVFVLWVCFFEDFFDLFFWVFKNLVFFDCLDIFFFLLKVWYFLLVVNFFFWKLLGFCVVVLILVVLLCVCLLMGFCFFLIFVIKVLGFFNV